MYMVAVTVLVTPCPLTELTVLMMTVVYAGSTLQ